MMVLDLDRLNDLPAEEAGATVHAELCRINHRPELDGSKIRYANRLDRTHPLRKWQYELTVYMKLRCGRCGLTQPKPGLSFAYWGEWLCSPCVDELGRPGGLLDQNGWPKIDRAAA